jgi:hypothetical protein
MYWLLAREVLRMKAQIARGSVGFCLLCLFAFFSFFSFFLLEICSFIEISESAYHPLTF